MDEGWQGEPLALDGYSLTIDQVLEVARGRRRVTIGTLARRRVRQARDMVDALQHAEVPVYGLTTGFGALRNRVISPEDISQLQLNLIRSHACGVGTPFAEDVVRAATLLRINTLVRGNSGIRMETIESLVAILNDDIFPFVPSKGSVGSSGDLAPLSHLALVVIGDPEGRVYRRDPSPDGAPPALALEPTIAQFTPLPDVWHEADAPIEGQPPRPGTYDKAAWSTFATARGWRTFGPVSLQAKEGLALNNGTQFQTACAVLAVYDAERLLRAAELGTTLCLEARQGVLHAYDPRVHDARPHPYQRLSAARIRVACAGSELVEGATAVLNPAMLRRARGTVRTACDRAVRYDLGPELVVELERIDRKLTGGLVDRPRFEALIRDLPGLRADLVELAAKQLRLDPPTEPERLGAREAAVEDLEDAARDLAKVSPRVPDVQDDYSFRCAPQVLGAAWSTWAYAQGVVATEINTSNDNPLLFPSALEPDPNPAPDQAADSARAAEAGSSRVQASATTPQAARGDVISAGNFHGEPIGMAMDVLKIGLAEAGNIAERRVAALVDAVRSGGLPPFLAERPGLNSGFMIPQYTAAALVSENKILCHPATVDSIPTSAGAEDHNAMGTIAARKAIEVIGNVRTILAIEWLVAQQALAFRAPLAPGRVAQAIVQQLAAAGVTPFKADAVFAPAIRTLEHLITTNSILALLPSIDLNTPTVPAA